MNLLSVVIFVSLFVFESGTQISSSAGDHQRTGVEAVWTAWAPWSACSAPCGVGLKTRYRDCVGYSPRGLIRMPIESCAGNAKEHVICNQQPCPAKTPDPRVEQCHQQNNNTIQGRTYQWTPFHGGVNPCQLTCLASGFSFLYNFGFVKDGTLCGKGNLTDMCVEGKCLSIGCDDRVGSGTQLDRCHVCGGKNEHCVFYQNVYDKDAPHSGDYGYTEVTKIPAGASHLEVSDHSKNYLAVADSSQTYIINGNWIIDWPGKHQVAGTTIHYQRSRDGNETITAEGPTKEDLYLSLIFREKNPGVTYGYWIADNKLEEIRAAETTAKENNKAYDSFYEKYGHDLDGRYRSPYGGNKKWSSAHAQDEQSEVVEEHAPSASIVVKKTEQVPGLSVDVETKEDSPAEVLSDSIAKSPKSMKETVFDKMSVLMKSKKQNLSYYMPQGKCGKCHKAKHRRKRFCQSDFVIRGQLVSIKYFGNHTRYEIKVIEKYKDIISLLDREYVWISDRCHCPLMRLYKDYVIMGNLVTILEKNESRLQLDKDSYVRLFHHKNEARLRSLSDKTTCEGKSKRHAIKNKH